MLTSSLGISFKQLKNSGYVGTLLFIQLATGIAYFAESAMQVAGCWHQWWATEGSTHLLHDLYSIQPRPHPLRWCGAKGSTMSKMVKFMYDSKTVVKLTLRMKQDV